MFSSTHQLQKSQKESFFHSRKFPFNFSGVDGCWEIYPLALRDTILCLTMIFATLLVPQRSPCLAVKRLDQLRSHTALLKVCHQVPLLLHYTWCPGTVFPLSPSFVKSPLYTFMYKLKIVMGLPWERFQI